ncbi:hypothetical protein [Acinetobacter colistiniresistens]|uniref:hypothetical protein n=1 Tax=Acinetobacter colistiniresistens TaxID=280145 RepID=UPI0012502C43|nr:hypothetical protein [Acinetobacter colistiniresistens]
MTEDLIKALLYAIDNKSKEARTAALREKFGNLGQEDLLNVIDGLVTVGVDYASSCNDTLHLHLVTTGDMHPYAVDKLNMPSFVAAIKGLRLVEKAPNQNVLCESCAYRCGTLANHSDTTQADLEQAKRDKAIFYCHQEIENLDNPTAEDRKRMRPCRGWAQDVKDPKNEK